MSPAELPLAPAACSLDAEALAGQAARYEALAGSVESLERAPGRLAARLATGVDRSVIEDAIAVERGCCPFLAIAYDPSRRTLTVEAAAEHQETLDALASALSR